MEVNSFKLYIELLNNINKLHIVGSCEVFIIGLEFINRMLTVITQHNEQIQRTSIELAFECKSKKVKYAHPTNQIIIALELKREDSKLISSELDMHDQLNLIWNAKYFEQVNFIGCYKTQSPLIKNSKWRDQISTNEMNGDDLAEYMDQVTISNNKETNKLFKKVRNLPSEGWTELVECWVCHNEEYTTIKPSSFSNQGIFFPDEGLLHVGTRSILFHPNHLHDPLFNKYKKIVDDHMKTYSSTNPEHLNELIYLEFECLHCSEKLGKIIIDPVLKGNWYPIVISIPKHHIYSQNPFNEEKSTIPCSILILQDLYDLNQYNSISKFILKNNCNEEGPRVKITIMNWQIYINSIELNQKIALRPCTKFIYEIVTNDDEESDSGFQVIEYPSTIVRELIGKIKANQLYLSPSKRKFRSNPISILFWN